MEVYSRVIGVIYIEHKQLKQERDKLKEILDKHVLMKMYPAKCTDEIQVFESREEYDEFMKFIWKLIVQDGTKKEFIKKYECQFEPTWGYDISDVNAVNKMLDDMIEEILSKGDVSYGY